MLEDDVTTVIKRLGRRLKAVREARGMTQEQAAGATGIPWRRLQDVEGGRANVTVRTLVRFARVYEVEVDELFRRDPEADGGAW